MGAVHAISSPVVFDLPDCPKKAYAVHLLHNDLEGGDLEGAGSAELHSKILPFRLPRPPSVFIGAVDVVTPDRLAAVVTGLMTHYETHGVKLRLGTNRAFMQIISIDQGFRDEHGRPAFVLSGNCSDGSAGIQHYRIPLRHEDMLLMQFSTFRDRGGDANSEPKVELWGQCLGWVNRADPKLSGFFLMEQLRQR